MRKWQHGGSASQPSQLLTQSEKIRGGRSSSDQKQKQEAVPSILATALDAALESSEQPPTLSSDAGDSQEAEVDPWMAKQLADAEEVLRQRPRRQRVVGHSLVARASKYSKDPEIRKAFEEMNGAPGGVLSLADLRSYLCDHLGFGQAEANLFFKRHANAEGHVTFERFREGYATLNPYMIAGREKEVIIRKPGSLRGEGITLEKLEDCEIYICDTTAQVFLDYCKRCVVLLGPCQSSVFVRDSEDCTLWMAAQQLRTRDCKHCAFYLHSHTEPIIEASDELAFAPWAAHYPLCSSHFQQAGFDSKKNLWNAIFDFSGVTTRSHWRILPLDELVELSVELDEPPNEAKLADNPAPEITHDMLCAAPVSSGQSCGQGVVNIPQTRPPLPKRPAVSHSLIRFLARDGYPGKICGAKRLTKTVTPPGKAVADAQAKSASPIAAKAPQPAAPSMPTPPRSSPAADKWGDDGVEIIEV